MSAALVPLPALTEADPVVAGEGSLDPLGLAQIADRLAEHLLPGLRARMRRIRFLTIAAVGACAADDIVDRAPADGVSTSSICYEWLVLEAFARKGDKDSPLEASGVPGSTKVKSVLAQHKRLSARNYLKAPSVFGFTGVYLPLARHFRVLDEDRHPAANIEALTRAWEWDSRLHGFTDANLNTEGGKLRHRIKMEIQGALSAGQCVAEPGTHLWRRLADTLHPLRPGPRERKLLLEWLTANDEPVRAQLARVVSKQAVVEEAGLVDLVYASRPSADLDIRLKAITDYEAVAGWLEAAFRQLCFLSRVQGTTPLSSSAAADDPVISQANSALPDAMARAEAALAALDTSLLTIFVDRLGRFATRMKPMEFVEELMTQHAAVQAAKPPKGKRPWFDRYGPGWVVRSLYWPEGPANPDRRRFVHPYRLAPLQAFMKDLET